MDIPWQTLQYEVLWLTFTAIEKKSDLMQLLQVCKHWSCLAYKRLYHAASIDQTPFLMPYARTLENSAYESENPFSALFGGSSGETNILEHLKTCLQLKKLDVSYRDEGFLYQADVFITKCIEPMVNNHAYLTGFGKPQLSPFDLATVTPQPKIKRLVLDIFHFTVQGLQYVMQKFTSLVSFTVNCPRDQRNVSILTLSESDNVDPLVMLVKMRQFLVSLKRFKMTKLCFHFFNIEAFSFWAEHPQLKALAILKCFVFQAEAVNMTVLSKDKEVAGFQLDDF